MRILFFGDIFGRPGREAIKKYLPELKEKYKPDFTIANVENIAHGSGVTVKTLSEIDELGIFDAYTSGNHIYKSHISDEVLNKKEFNIIQPANFSQKTFKNGYTVLTSGAKRLLLINLLGIVFMEDDVMNPFLVVNDILEKYTIHLNEDDKEYVDAIFIDFHAEATSEKRLMGFHLDGRVSAILGTHTHVPTNDEQILLGGSAYITDLGMVGAYNSSLGLDKDIMLKEHITGVKQKREVSDETLVEVGGVLIEVNKNGLANSIKTIRELVEI